ncbi:MAG: hypothetical protein LUJ25_05030 [Firmicutes bacterium]|nr:hypothetical protein [Bacillota bacterium]
MKTEKKYYTSEDLKGMGAEELRQIVQEKQQEIESLRWSVREIQELLIAAIQSLPKTLTL